MVPGRSETHWQTNWVKPSFLSNKGAISPAEIGEGLCKIIMTKGNILEDANYNKILPNRFVVELSQDVFRKHYEPLEQSLIQQWREKLVEHLMTTNSRLGRKEYRFGGQLHIALRPAADIVDNRACVLSRVEPHVDLEGQKPSSHTRMQGEETGYLESVNGDRRWPLFPGDNTIGRDASSDVFLDIPVIQAKRLVSGQHARIYVDRDQHILYDGSLTGKPSANGTYVNSQRIPDYGLPLQNGDIIILGALHPQHPSVDTPGVAVLRFQQNTSME
jgi:hypothetical protein